MDKFGNKFATVGLIAGLALLPVPGYADGDSSDFVNELLNAPTNYTRYERKYDYRYDRPQITNRAPTNVATVRARALPPTPFVALRQTGLKPGKEMGTYASAVHEQLLDPSGEALRVRPGHRKAIIKFYKDRNFKPVWLGDYGMADKAKRVLDLMSKAEEEGLNARDYLPASLSDFDDQATGLANSPAALAKLDVEITVAALEYSHHVSAGRVKPIRISKLHTLKAKPVAAKDVLFNLKSTLRPDVYLASLQPMIPQYRYLKKALSRYRSTAGSEEAIYIPAGALIRAGAVDDRIELIARRLDQLGYYEFKPQTNVEDGSNRDEANTATSQRDVYNSALVSAVKDMQEQSGLRRDGIIGRNTLSALNGQSSSEKISKIILSMERLRWLPQDLKTKYVFINQAFFETWMMDDGRWQGNFPFGRNCRQAHTSDSRFL